jgi:hypothetical protein
MRAAGRQGCHAGVVPEQEAQPELIVYPPERIDESGEVLPGGAPSPLDLRYRFEQLPPRQQRALLAAGVALVVVFTFGALSHLHPRIDTAKPPVLSVTSTPNVPQRLGLPGRRIPIGSGTPIDLAAGASLLYVLTRTPPRLVSLDPAATALLNSVTIADGSALVVSDPQADRLWTVSTDGVVSVVHRYDPLFLNLVSQVKLPTVVNAAAALRGELWLAAAGGLYRIPTGTKTAIRVPGIDGAVRAIAADPAHDRVLASVGDAPATVIAIKSGNALIERQQAVGVGKVSIAVTVGGLWVAGYGGPDERKLIQLDPQTLAVVGGSPLEFEVGPGAIVWPGRDAVWVRGGGNEDLACMSATTGAVRARWHDIAGPVISGDGIALSVSVGYVVALQIRHTPCSSG